MNFSLELGFIIFCGLSIVFTCGLVYQKVLTIELAILDIRKLISGFSFFSSRDGEKLEKRVDILETDIKTFKTSLIEKYGNPVIN